jgi:glycerol-3-phosphate dehydrogenase (NAD(P)+)
MKATVLGAGSFGTAMASVLSANFERVTMWARDASLVEQINVGRQNTAYLPQLTLSEKIQATSDLKQSLTDSAVVVVAIPSQGTRSVMQAAAPYLHRGVPIVTVAKGIENDTLLTMTEVLESCLPEALRDQVAVLSGPSFAKEMVQKMPTVVTIASRSESTAQKAQRLCQSEHFRSYTSTDVVGVQVGGALKNVIAIAAGMADGLGLGHNARAAIITRGLAEISRIAVRMGGQALTLSGLAGMGDLVLTCTGELSRNRRVGFELGRGRALEQVLADMNQVVEGIKTAKSARDLSVKFDVELPICAQVHAIAFEGKSPRAAVLDLMVRAPKAEHAP